MPIDAARIEQHGWSQGAVLPVNESQRLVVPRLQEIALDGFQFPADGRLILASHTCDVVHRGVFEPRVEVIPASPVPRIDGNCTDSRNPRRLHLPVTIDGEGMTFEVWAPTRFSINREELEQFAPDPTCILAPKELRTFKRWLSKRLDRTALPTEFDRRIDRRARRAIKRILEDLPHVIDIVLIAVDPDDRELVTTDEAYTIQVVGLLDEDVAMDEVRRARADQAMMDIGNALEGCDGINVAACIAEPSNEMTVSEFSDFVMWDYDYLSLAADADAPDHRP